jgi:hypothetical protein
MADKNQKPGICIHCGQPTGEHEFVCGSEGKVRIHFQCAIERGSEIIESGALDETRMTIDWGDGTVDLRTGKQLREKK